MGRGNHGLRVEETREYLLQSSAELIWSSSRRCLMSFVLGPWSRWHDVVTTAAATRPRLDRCSRFIIPRVRADVSDCLPSAATTGGPIDFSYAFDRRLRRRSCGGHDGAHRSTLARKRFGPPLGGPNLQRRSRVGTQPGRRACFALSSAPFRPAFGSAASCIPRDMGLATSRLARA